MEHNLEVFVSFVDMGEVAPTKLDHTYCTCNMDIQFADTQQKADIVGS